MGLIMRPNKLIERKGNPENYNIFFSEQTVKDLAHDFIQNNHQGNSSIEHATKIDGVSIVELWIVDDAANDKANANGLNPMKGDCFGCMKIDNDAIWNDFVKTGKVKGFSIDAMVNLEEISNQNNLNMNAIVKAIEDGFKAALSHLSPAFPVKMGRINSADGSVVIEFDGDTPTVGNNVWVTDPAGTQVPLPAGEFPVVDDAGVASIIVVTEIGKIAEVKVAETAPAVMAAAPAVTAETATAVSEAIKSIMIKYSEETATRELALSTQIAELNAKIVTLSAAPAATPIVSQPQAAAQKGRFNELLNEL
jgi:hypothetical protein